MDVLGLDIGGANLKAAHTSGAAASVPFALWRSPERLSDELRQLVAAMPPWQRVAVTMTGELCDCFESKAQGVAHLLDAAAEVFGAAALDVWTNSGRFSDARTAKDCWLLTASANWLALATFAGRFAPPGFALLLDVGTTTTDLIPLRDGVPTPRGFTDPERMLSGELIYRGWRRTPLCAVFPGPGVAAELFATMHDACLVTGLVPEDADDRDTADGRPATVEAARRRIARMRCAGPEELSERECGALADSAVEQFAVAVERSLRRLLDGGQNQPAAVIVSGSGSFLADILLESLAVPRILLDERIGPSASAAACAYAVAVLRAEAG
jgi:(4-(4-[2-(gamma-L-glutamylamino)ethyl]phenoxymethyl)furan-2-yl)methanamine synthase